MSTRLEQKQTKRTNGDEEDVREGAYRLVIFTRMSIVPVSRSRHKLRA